MPFPSALPPVVVFPPQDVRAALAQRVNARASVMIVFFIFYSIAVVGTSFLRSMTSRFYFALKDALQVSFLRGILWNKGSFLKIKLIKCDDELERIAVGVKILALLMAMVLNSECRFRNVELFESEGCEVRMTCSEGDVIEVWLELLCDGGMCGAVGDISYDAESFLLLSCGIEEMSGVNFSFFDSGGDVRILIDGVENFTRGVRVSFYFGRADGYSGGGIFMASGIEVYAISELEDVCRVDADECAACELVCEDLSVDEERVIVVNGVEVERGETGEVEVVIFGCASGDFFAAGFRMFVVELNSGASESFFVVGVIRGGGAFERRVSLTSTERHSFVVTPLAFDRYGTDEGEKKVFIN